MVVVFVMTSNMVLAEKIHACIPADSCGGKKINGIDIEYNCVCHEGWAGQYCDQKSNRTNRLSFRTRRVASRSPQFYCEDIETKCVNGVTEVTKKTAKC
ncbi:unnamed protein product [Bursaphelenchus xylophilus]|uniref:(pine wood nematode) hypothetical protein n=1 Tax=Bursaphelenchus xylophilus TaxID=6326 RepID=A0A1I7S717_BURXY|nr:unnamed protein product [Bursaphelenchus xylophilus]CAG9079419.1 unnamed protein product [Bursaphelenchus xylophilus]